MSTFTARPGGQIGRLVVSLDRLARGACAFVMFMSSIVSPAATAANPENAELRDRALAVLRGALATEQGWVRVHAAEALIAVGDGAHVREIYLRDLPALEQGPQRVGAWRVLAATAPTPAVQAAWLAKIEAAFLTDGAPDRLQAIESLCKLKSPVTGGALQRVRAMSEGPDGEQPLACWALHLAGDRAAAGRITRMLTSADPAVRLRAAYALRWLKPKDSAILAALADAAERESPDSLARPFLLSTALSLRAEPAREAAWLQCADELIATGPTSARYELCQALIQRGTPGDARRYTLLFEQADGDARIGGAWRVLDLLRQ